MEAILTCHPALLHRMTGLHGWQNGVSDDVCVHARRTVGFFSSSILQIVFFFSDKFPVVQRTVSSQKRGPSSGFVPTPKRKVFIPFGLCYGKDDDFSEIQSSEMSCCHNWAATNQRCRQERTFDIWAILILTWQSHCLWLWLMAGNSFSHVLSTHSLFFSQALSSLWIGDSPEYSRYA